MTKKPYRGTTVGFAQSQKQIEGLLAKYHIFDVQHTKGYYVAKRSYCIMITFSYREEKDMEKQPMMVRIVIPVEGEPSAQPSKHRKYEKSLNQMYRALFWYLKSKFESLAFGFEFLQEFLPHIVVAGPNGQLTTVYEGFKPAYLEGLEKGTVPQLPNLFGDNDTEEYE